MVEALEVIKVLPFLAEILAKMTLNNLFMGIFVVGLISASVCNIINNIPMTILFTRMLQHEFFAAICDPITTQGCMFALVIGSNFGANFTLVGALAGIMWNSILRQKSMEISYGRFARTGLMICPWVLFVSLAVFSLTCWIFIK